MNPREGEVRIPSGCAIAGMISRSGQRFGGERIIEAMSAMHERCNGLGGGFAAYGIYPEYRDYYAFHVFYESAEARRACEAFLEEHFDIINLSRIPTRKMAGITDEPMIWRYFVLPLPTRLAASQLDEREFVVRCVFRINTGIKGCYVFSSGKNMGVFKAVGYPEDVGRFYRLEEYEGYCFTAHGRYPTNTPGCGAARIPLRCWTGRWCITARSRPTTPTVVFWRCSAITAPCRPTPRSSPTPPITCCGGGV